MGELKIAKNKAIEILQQRIDDLGGWPTPNEHGWISRTAQDVNEIFVGIPGIKRVHEIESLKYAPNGEWSKRGKAYLLSYIAFIKDYVTDEVAQRTNSIKTYQKEYLALLTKYNALSEKHVDLEKSYFEAADLVGSQSQIIEELESSMLQLNNFSLKKLKQIIGSLPWGDLGKLWALIVFIFLAGVTIGIALNKLHLV